MTPRSRALRVRGLRVGHATAPNGRTGVTTALFDRATPTVVDVRGGASATYDTASLSLDATFGRRWAIFFAGGSLFGLDAAAGVRRAILESGGGGTVFGVRHRVAPISGAALFDLPGDDEPLPDYRSLGYEAARAGRSDRIALGRVGAGAGARVGKYRGRGTSMRGGIGWAEARLAGRARVGALVAVNAVGGVRDPGSGQWVAGARGSRGRIVPPIPSQLPRRDVGGTTLSLLVTDLPVERPVLQRAAAIVHASLGGTVVPFQTATDGDVLFAAATGMAPAPRTERRPGEVADLLGTVGGLVAGEAARRAVDGAPAASSRRSGGAGGRAAHG